MDRVRYVDARRVHLEPAEREASPRRFDVGAWFYHWFGAGAIEHFLGPSHPTTLYWAQRVIDQTLSHGS